MLSAYTQLDELFHLGRWISGLGVIVDFLRRMLSTAGSHSLALLLSVQYIGRSGSFTTGHTTGCTDLIIHRVPGYSFRTAPGHNRPSRHFLFLLIASCAEIGAHVAAKVE